MKLVARRRAPAPALTTTMIALAWSVIHCPDEDGEDARVLAQLILDAAQAQA